MGMCDPKAVRAGRPWYEQVNDPGFMRGQTPGRLVSPMSARDNKSSVSNKLENKMITPERKAQLTAEGFYVEDMGQEHGAEFAGQYRWMNSISGDFQDFEPSYSEDAAWRECANHNESAK
jgi:hypothetical protein